MRIVKNILLLSTGTGIAQLIPFVAAIFIARLYTESDFGDLSIFLAITGIVGVAATFRYELAIILPRKINDARNLLVLCILNSLLIGLLSYLILFFCFPIFESKLEISNLNLLYLIPVMVIFMGIYNAFDNWFNRVHQYRKMAMNKVFLSISSNVLKILFGVLGISLGLIYGTVLGNLFAAGLFIFLYLKTDGFYSYKTISFNKLKKMFLEYKDFFVYSVPGALLNAVSNVGLPLLIAYFYSLELSGIYFFANMIIRQPLGLLSGSIAQVYKNEVNLLYLNAKDKMLSFTTKIQKTIFVFVFPILLLFSIFGGEIFSFVFGEKWFDSGELIKYFAIFVLFNVNYSPISSIGDVLRKQKFFLFFNLSLVLSQIILLILFSNKLEFQYMILLISISGATHFLIIDLYMKHCIKKII
jgi:O-antigen/teichoic acid export membrane protein